jgi:ketosteroid isomerase-like protein
MLAEGVGFEPTVPLAGHNGFRDRPVRPLRHPSVFESTVRCRRSHRVIRRSDGARRGITDEKGNHGEQENVALVKQGFEAFNKGDAATLSGLIAEDATQTVPGKNQLAGEKKGRDAMLAFYGQLAEVSNGTFRTVLQNAEADGPDRVIATYLGQGEREGKTLASTNRLTFTIRDGKFAKLVDAPEDLAAWDDFWG